MKRIGRITIMSLGVAFVALVIGLIAPRTARAAVSALVQVTNSAAQAIPVVDVNNSASTPFTFTSGYLQQNGFGCVNVNMPQAPAGKKWVIEYVSFYGAIGGPHFTSLAMLYTSGGVGGQSVYFPMSYAPGSTTYLSGGQSTKLYVDGGTLSQFNVCADNVLGTSNFIVTASGYIATN